MKKLVKISTLLLLTILCIGVFAGCVPGNSSKAQDKLYKAGYSVATIPTTAYGGDCTEAIFATKTLTSEKITAVWFTDSAAAKKFYEAAVGKSENNGLVVKQAGKCVYIASTTQAENDFLK